MKIKIGVNKNLDCIHDIMNEYLAGNKIKLKKEKSGHIHYFILIRNDFFSKKEYILEITNIIMDIIFNIYFVNRLKHKIYKKRNDIKNTEKAEISRLSIELLLDKNNFFLEKEQLYNKINMYLLENPIIYIDGFIRFQMQELDLFLNMIIDRGIEELALEKEYEEFIKILQYFVESQESKHSFINIIFKANDYIILDEKNNILEKDFFSKIIEEIEPNGISKEDLLIATLIVLAPQKIFIHLDEIHENKDVIKIISNVFQDEVYFCFGCPKCIRETQIKKEGR